jgi:hypothetical protein
VCEMTAAGMPSWASVIGVLLMMVSVRIGLCCAVCAG